MMVLAASKRKYFAIVHDALAATVSFILSVYLRLGHDQWPEATSYLGQGTMLFTVICVASFMYMRLYRSLWRYTSMHDIFSIIKAVTLAVLLFAAVMFTVNRLDGMPRSVPFINWMVLLCFIVGSRFFYRALYDRTFSLPSTAKPHTRIPVLLIGAGDAAEQFIRDMGRDPNAPYHVAGMVDDTPGQKGRTIHRVPIYGDSADLVSIIAQLEQQGARPQKLILSDEHIVGEKVREYLTFSEQLGIPFARLPRLSEFKHGLHDRPQLRPIAVEDLLGRAQNVLDHTSMQKLVHHKRVLITGAGGTIGSELTHQIAEFEPAELLLFELGEFNLYQIEREVRERFPSLPLRIVLGDIRDHHHVDTVFAQYPPQLVFHAAAIKHVPMAEYNIEEAVLTNVFGTKIIAEACHRYDVEVMVMISTDKAVNPANVMGATKKLAESFCQSLGYAQVSANPTKFITVRFGNVLGSTGSVVPLFQEQLSNGGPLTVTHPEMTRYFMTVREAVELVLQAAALGVTMRERHECIFVLDMGQPVKIVDLAQQMIRLAGLKPMKDIEIVFTGLRPGEKFYEELFHFSENAVRTSHESIFLASPRLHDMAELRRGLERLWHWATERNPAEALAVLKELVPEFQSLQPTSQ